MVVKKGETKDNVHWLQRQSDDVNRRNPIIETRYYVVEVTPSRHVYDGDGHGGLEDRWTSEKSEKVSPYFRTKKSAQKWMDEHEPDDGKSLAIVRQHKRRTVTEKWWSPHRLRT